MEVPGRLRQHRYQLWRSDLTGRGWKYIKVLIPVAKPCGNKFSRNVGHGRLGGGRLPFGLEVVVTIVRNVGEAAAVKVHGIDFAVAVTIRIECQPCAIR